MATQWLGRSFPPGGKKKRRQNAALQPTLMGTYTIADLDAPATYTVSAFSEGYVGDTKSVQVQSGQTAASINFMLGIAGAYVSWNYGEGKGSFRNINADGTNAGEKESAYDTDTDTHQ